jgi:hypothetical protein
MTNVRYRFKKATNVITIINESSDLNSQKRDLQLADYYFNRRLISETEPKLFHQLFKFKIANVIFLCHWPTGFYSRQIIMTSC